MKTTREIRYRIAMKKEAFKKKTFDHQIGLKFKEGSSKVLQFEHSFVWH